MTARLAHRRRIRPNLFGFGKRVTHSAKLLDKAFEEGKRTGDTSRFKDWFADQQEGDQKFSGSLKRRAHQAYRRGVEKYGEPSSGSGSKGIKADLFKARATIKDIAFDQGYNDEKQDRDRNLSSDEILDYISGQRDASGWESAMGKTRIASLYKHEYRQGQKKAKAEEKKEAKGEASSVVKEVTEALIGQGMKRAHAVSKAKGAFKTGQSFEETFRKAVAGTGKTSKMSSNRKRTLFTNPAKFDRCVSDVTKSLKAQKRPGNAYAICTAAGTKNPKWRKVDSYRTLPAANAVASKYVPAKVVKRGRKWQVWTRQRLDLPKTTRARNARVVWTAKQGKLRADIQKPFLGSYRVVIKRDGQVVEDHPAKKFGEAVAISRLRLADTSIQNPKAAPAAGLRRVPGISRAFRAAKSRKNPMDLALKRYEEFHGMPSEEILEFTEQEHYHSAKVGLGQLVSLLVTLVNGKTVPLNSPGFSEKGVNGRKYWEFDVTTPTVKRVYLTSSEDGKQLFIDGGDQSIPTDALRALGITKSDEHDHMLIGTIRMVTYRTRKSFEGKGKEEVDFHHKFGSEGSKGIAPVLLYFPRSQKLKIAGGRYSIAAPERDLGVSPGIVG